MIKSSRPADPDERRKFIEDQVAAREARQRIERLEEAARLLDRAISAVRQAQLDAASVTVLLDQVLARLDEASNQAGRRLLPRSRPVRQKQWEKAGPRKRYHLYIDESGGSRLNLTTDGRYFALGGLLVEAADDSELQRRWTAWKLEWIGSEHRSMHAQHLRRNAIRYYARAKPEAFGEEILESLDRLLRGFPITLFVTAIDKRAFQQQYLHKEVGALLPGSHYELCLDMLLERVVYCLLQDDDAHGHVFAESRNRAENAALQLEYQRLQIEGTVFQHPTWFRYQLGPHITFQSKRDNIAGLQVVDVLLKAVVDRLNAPSEEPLRWAVAREKLYRKEKGRLVGWGLKVFPSDLTLADAALGVVSENETEDAP